MLRENLTHLVAESLLQELGFKAVEDGSKFIEFPISGEERNVTLSFLDHRITKVMLRRKATTSFSINASFSNKPPRGEVLCIQEDGTPAIAVEDDILRFRFNPFYLHLENLAEGFNASSLSRAKRIALRLYWSMPESFRSALRAPARKRVVSQAGNHRDLQLFGISSNVIVKLIENHLINCGLAKSESIEPAIVITHDVDRDFCQTEGMDIVAAIEEDFDICSTWFFVPKSVRYSPNRRSIEGLMDAGHEIGMHGFSHSGGLSVNDYEKLSMQIMRGREILENHGVTPVSFRSPYMLRSVHLLKVLTQQGFIADSSYPDVDTLGTTGKLVGTTYNRPFRPIDWTDSLDPQLLGIWEIPSGSPQDVQLIEDLGLETDEVISVWKKKAQFCQDFGGVFVFHTHPWHIAMDPDAYAGFLEECSLKSCRVKDIASDLEEQTKRAAE